MSRTKLEQLEFEKKLAPFYNLEGGKFYCKKCTFHIRNRYEDHYNNCNGHGTRRSYNDSVLVDKNLYSPKCDMGCGQTSKFFHKNGNAYCSKLGSSCPIKVEKDRLRKIGINPFKEKLHPKGALGKKGWNNGLTKETSSIIFKSSEKFKETIKNKGHFWKNPSLYEDTKKKLSNYAKKRSLGGYVEGGGRGKKGWYKGIFCDSSWELAYVIYCLEHGIEIKRSKDRRVYTWEDKTKIYIPDFIVENQTIEIKGYKNPQWLAKLKANQDIKVFYKEDMKPILDYVKEKYGKNFIYLYEKNDKTIKK